MPGGGNIFPRLINQCFHYETDKKLNCFICINGSSDEKWPVHLRSQQHHAMLPYFYQNFTKLKVGYQCNVCSVKVCRKSIAQHLTDHKIFPWYLETSNREEYLKLYPNFIQKCNEHGFYCHACNKYLEFLFMAYTHIEDDDHQQKLALHGAILSPKNDKFLLRHGVFCYNYNHFECKICDASFKGKKLAVDHIHSHQHGSNLRKFYRIKCSNTSENLATNNNSPIVNNKNLIKPVKNSPQGGNKSETKKSSRKFRKIKRRLKTETQPGTKEKSFSPKGNSRNNVQKMARNHNIIQNFRNTRNIYCEKCGKKVKVYSELHQHQTAHFVSDFPEKKVEEKKTSVKDLDDSIKEIIAKMLAKLNTETNPSEPVAELKLPANIEENFDSLNILEPPVVNIMRKDEILDKLDLNNSNAPDLNIYDFNEKQLDLIKNSSQLLIRLDDDKFHCLICRSVCEYSVEAFFEHINSILHMGYLKMMLSDHEKFSNHPDEFSDFKLGLELMEDVSKEAVQCHACEKKITNTLKDIKDHINEDLHQNKLVNVQLESKIRIELLISYSQRDWYKVQIYWCIPCGMKYVAEKKFLGHLQDDQHLISCQRYKEYENLNFNFCSTCGALFYGFEEAYAFHSECKMHKYALVHKFYSTYEMPAKGEMFLVNGEKIIDEIIADMDKNKTLNDEKSEAVKKDLEKIAQKYYPNSKVYLFGSRVSGLASKHSDLDAFIDCSGFHYYKNNPDVLSSIKTLEKSLKENEKTWRIHRTVLDTRIPIIVIEHKPTQIMCDLSFINGITTENSLLLQTFVKKFPLTRKLIIFTKEWIKKTNLTGPRGIHSYALALMVIFYLQTRNILPKITDLLTGASKLVSFWEVGIDLDFPTPKCDLSFQELAVGFFKYYSDFDYRHKFICPLIGKPMDKIDFVQPESLPEIFKPYKNYAKSIVKNSAELFRIDSPIGVQDPFDLSHNTSKSVKKTTLYKFKTCCAISAQILSKS